MIPTEVTIRRKQTLGTVIAGLAIAVALLGFYPESLHAEDPAGQTELTLTPSDFVTIRSEEPDFNSAKSERQYLMVTGGYATTDDHREFREDVLMRFNLVEAGVSGTVVSATFKGMIHGGAAGGSPTSESYIYRITGSWDVAEVTWNTRPTLSKDPLSSGLGALGIVNEIDITDLVKEWVVNPSENHGLAAVIRDPGGGMGMSYGVQAATMQLTVTFIPSTTSRSVLSEYMARDPYADIAPIEDGTALLERGVDCHDAVVCGHHIYFLGGKIGAFGKESLTLKRYDTKTGKLIIIGGVPFSPGYNHIVSLVGVSRQGYVFISTANQSIGHLHDLKLYRSRPPSSTFELIVTGDRPRLVCPISRDRLYSMAAASNGRSWYRIGLYDLKTRSDSTIIDNVRGTVVLTDGGPEIYTFENGTVYRVLPDSTPAVASYDPTIKPFELIRGGNGLLYVRNDRMAYRCKMGRVPSRAIIKGSDPLDPDLLYVDESDYIYTRHKGMLYKSKEQEG
jgi:hypothetical protein